MRKRDAQRPAPEPVAFRRKCGCRKHGRRCFDARPADGRHALMASLPDAFRFLPFLPLMKETSISVPLTPNTIELVTIENFYASFVLGSETW